MNKIILILIVNDQHELFTKIIKIKGISIQNIKRLYIK